MSKPFLFLAICFLAIKVQAQDTTVSYLDNFIYTVQWSPQHINSQGDTVILLSCNLNIPDTHSISAISVSVGSYKGDKSKIDYTFPIDANVGLPNGYYIQKNGASIEIKLGTHTPGFLYFQVVLHDIYGKKSKTLYYNPITHKLSI